MWLLAGLAALTFFGVRILNSPKSKGRVGEARLRRALESILDKNVYSFLHDITLPSGNGTTQIDHVLVSPYGVFVIETKNYSGWIYGSAKQRQWTHVFHRKKFRFQNPLHQNYKHCRAVHEATGLDPSFIHSLVVFVGSGKFKTSMPEEVTDIKGLRRYFWAKSRVVLTEDEINLVLDRIDSQRYQRGYLTDRKHNMHVGNTVAQRSNRNGAASPQAASVWKSIILPIGFCMLVLSLLDLDSSDQKRNSISDREKEPINPSVEGVNGSAPPLSLRPVPESRKPLNKFDLISGTVVVVSAGDAFTLDSNGTRYEFRLAEIDAPVKGQEWFGNARSALEEKVADKVITVEVSTLDRDIAVGRVWYKGRDINREMVREGHAKASEKYLTDHTFLEDESLAHSERTGLWRLEDRTKG